MIEAFATAVFGERLDRAAFPDLDLPEDVVLRSGRLIPALGGFFSRMGGPAAAVTIGKTILLHPDLPLTRKLLAHELAHVRQWRQDPFFPVKYSIATLRYGYTNNPYEVEARAFADAASGNPPGQKTS